jgi:hypothetical protein
LYTCPHDITAALLQVRQIMRKLPAILMLATAVLKELTDAAAGSVAALVKSVGGEAAAGSSGAFLHTLRLLLRLLRKPAVQAAFAAADASAYHGVTRAVSTIAHVLIYSSATSILPDIMAEVLGLVEYLAVAPEVAAGAAPMDIDGGGGGGAGAVAPAALPHATLAAPERVVLVLRRMAELARARQHRSGNGPFWLRGFEDLLYRLCVNEGARLLTLSRC